MNQGELYVLAASYLGESVPSDGGAVKQAFDDVVQQCIRLALDYTSWEWANKKVTLPVVNGEVDLPADCLEIKRCSANNWEIIGRTLVIQDERKDVEMVYKSDAWASQLALPDYEPYFCEGVALLLASKAAPRVTANLRLSGEMERMAYEKLYRAKLKLVRSTDSNDQKPKMRK